jgi:hypothetical protein
MSDLRSSQLWLWGVVSYEIYRRVVWWKSGKLCVPCSACSSTLKMEATRPSEPSVDFQRSARSYIPEDTNLQLISCSLKEHAETIRLSSSQRGPLSLVSTIEELRGRKSSGSGLENREYGRKDVTLTTWHPLSAKVGTNFADKRRLFGRYSSLAVSGHSFQYELNENNFKNSVHTTVWSTSNADNLTAILGPIV